MLGGYLADRFLGTHRSLVIGGLIIAAGHFRWRLPSLPTFFLGLALVAIGTGFFKTNASTMVGQLYEQGDKRRDAGFTIFYMGVNVGAFFGPIVCGYFAESPRWGWHWGFGAAGVGMVLGLVDLPGVAVADTWPASARPPTRAGRRGDATSTPRACHARGARPSDRAAGGVRLHDPRSGWRSSRRPRR